MLVSTAMLGKGIEELKADREIGEGANFRSYFLVHYLSLLTLFANYSVVCYKWVQLIPAFVLCLGQTAPVKFVRVPGNFYYVQQTPTLEKRSAWPFLVTDLESCTGEKWLGVGDAV